MKIFYIRLIPIHYIILFLSFLFPYKSSPPPNNKELIPPSKPPLFENHQINPLEIESDITNLNNDYFVVSTKDGYIHLYHKDTPPTKMWSIFLGKELMSTNIINKNIIYESKVLIPMEGKLFILTNKNEVQFEEFTIPITELINRAPFSLGFMPEYYFLGNKSTNLLTIDINKGILLQNEFGISKKDNVINVFRIDYTLICCKNNEQIWNTTVSDIVLVDKGSRNELMLAKENYEVVNSFIDSEIKRGDIYSVHDYDYKRHAPIKIFDRRSKKVNNEQSNFDGDEEYLNDSDEYQFEHYSMLNNVLKWKTENKKKRIMFHYRIKMFLIDIAKKMLSADNFYIILIDVIIFGAIVGVIIMRLTVNKQKKKPLKENEIIKQFYSETNETKIESSLFNKKKNIKKTEHNSDKENYDDDDDNEIQMKNIKSRARFRSVHEKSRNILFNQPEEDSSKKNLPQIPSKQYKEEDEEKKENKPQLMIQTETTDEPHSPESPNIKAQTRLEKDFSEFVKIGQGGFGCVLKARHRIDEEIYAIKIIRLEYPNEQNVVKEAKTMTKIHSKHIVEYKTCWFDTSLGSLADLVYSNDDDERSITMTKSKSFSKLNKKFTETNLIRPLDRIVENEEEDKDELNNMNLINCNVSNTSNNFMDDNEANSNDPNIIFEDDKTTSNNNTTTNNVNYNDSYITKKIFDESLSDAENKSLTSTSKDHVNLWVDFRDDTSRSISRNSNISRKELCKLETFFFIQMEFCDGLSLKQYIDEHRSTGLDKHTIFIFSFQLAKSLKKIHNKNIIHRDIKPDNIFVYNNNSIKIGDFGLATEVKNDKNAKNFFSPSKSRNGSRMNLDTLDQNSVGEVEGTPIYLSPEQLERRPIDGKVDIYAMGLVLYEMCGCFETYMERRTSIENLKNNRVICDKVLTNYPIQSKLIMKMTEKKPQDRPTACEVLNSEEFKEWEESLEE